MTDANRNPGSPPDKSLGAAGESWRDRLNMIASYLTSKNVEGIRLEYSSRGKFRDFDIECFAHGNPKHLYVPQSLVEEFVAVFAKLLEKRDPGWDAMSDVNGVFEWYVGRNALIQRHVDPKKDAMPALRYGL